MSIGIIQNNPFRILGVYANATRKDIVANQGKMKAFLKVGKKVSFPADLDTILPPVERTETSVAEADSKLTLPNERLRYGQFWFVNSTPEDEAAFKHLSAGDIDAAINVWSETTNVSSVQNRLICYLIKGDYQQMVNMAVKLYEPFEAEFEDGVKVTNLFDLELTRLILSDNETKGINSKREFLNALCEEIGSVTVYGMLPEGDLKETVAEFAINPIISQIQSAIASSDESNEKVPEERYDAGVKLMEETKPLLEQLRQILPPTDMQYELIADKLGLAILQCGIDYFNGSGEPTETTITKAMALQEYVKSIVVGESAKDRCKENVDILNTLNEQRTPEKVNAEDAEIKALLDKYDKLPKTIELALALLQEAKPILGRISSILGYNNPYYLKVSTMVVEKALSNIIERVNAAQRAVNQVLGDEDTHNDMDTKSSTLMYFKDVVNNAVRVSLMMDEFDMDDDYLNNRYKPNREILESLYRDVENAGRGSSSSSSEGSGWGCIIYGIIAFIIFLFKLLR